MAPAMTFINVCYFIAMNFQADRQRCRLLKVWINLLAVNAAFSPACWATAPCPWITTEQSSNGIALNNTANYFSLHHLWEWWSKTQYIVEQGGLEVFGRAGCLSVTGRPVFSTSTVSQQCCALNCTINCLSVSWLNSGLSRSDGSKLKAWKRGHTTVSQKHHQTDII